MDQRCLADSSDKSTLIEVTWSELITVSEQLEDNVWTSRSKHKKAEDLSRVVKTNVPRQPCSPESYLSSRFGALLSIHQWDQRWIGLVPARLGYYHSVDLAALAFLELYHFKRTQNVTEKNRSLQYYLSALACVQTILNNKSFWTSEEALLAVELLCASDCDNGTSLSERFAHKQGHLTLMIRSTCATELVRAMAYDDIGAYLIACARGEASLFESQFFMDLEPTFRQAPTETVASLKRITYRLHICLPRLMMLIRRLRAEPSDSTTKDEAFASGSALYNWKYDGAENELLHSVRVLKCCRAEDAYFVPIGLKFETLAEFQAAVFYWESRITLNRLCIHLQKLFPKLRLVEVDLLTQENCRMAKNLLMILESTFDRKAFGINRGGVGTCSFAMAITSVWGVLMDVKRFNGHSSEKIRESVLEWCQIFRHSGIENVGPEQMNEMADLFVGGPIQGLLPSLILGQSNGHVRPPNAWKAIEEGCS